MKGRPSGVVLSLALAAAVAGCQSETLPTDSGAPGGAVPDGPSLAMGDGTTNVDGTHEGGNPDFFFLSPLAFTNPQDDPDFEEGEFNGDLPPFVKVCEIDGLTDPGSDNPPAPASANPADDCVTDAAGEPVFVREFGPGDVSVDPVAEKYQVNWKTSDDLSTEDAENFYRILVLFDASSPDGILGFRDVDPENDPTVASDSDREYHVFQNGSNLPVKFRIENRVLCSADAGAECEAAAIFEDEGGTVATESGAIVIDAFDVPTEVGVVAVIVEEVILGDGEACLELGQGAGALAVGIPLAGPCFRIRTLPDLPAGFADDVAVCLAVETPDFAPNQSAEELFQIHRQDEEDGEAFALPNAPCPQGVFAAAEPDGLAGLAMRGLEAVRRGVFFWVDPPLLTAADLGLGGFTRSTSRFQWGLPVQMAAHAGHDPVQVVPVGTAVPVPPAVLVTDGDGAPAEGAVVGFSVAGPLAGDLVDPDFPDVVTTGPDGVAGAASWTLGPTPGVYELTARGVGVADDQDPGPFGDNEDPREQVQLGTGELTFTAIACAPGFGTPAAIDGVMDADEWACAESADFTANLSGGSGVPATLFWMNDAENLYLAVRVEHADDKSNELGFDFDNDGDGVVEAGDDLLLVSPDGDGPDPFSDRFVTEKCLKRGQALCGELDTADGGTRDGAGAFSSDGTSTTYELSHPLASGDLAHDYQRAAGQRVGLFLTLRLGKGAQGNTQWPGFREFLDLLIQSP